MYHQGKGTGKAPDEAAKWYRKSTPKNAEKEWDSPSGRMDIGWLRLAAEHGHSSAQYYLGLMYRNGRGTPVNFEEAIHWLRRSAEQDHSPAIGALQKLEHSLKG